MIVPPVRDGWMVQSDIAPPMLHGNNNLELDDLKGLSGYIYLGSPYSKYPLGQDIAAMHVGQAAAKLMSRGFPIFCPIAHSHFVGVVGGLDNLDWTLWQFQDQPLMDRAAALIVLMMDGWQESVGLKHEIECFVAAQKPIVYISPEAL